MNKISFLIILIWSISALQAQQPIDNFRMLQSSSPIPKSIAELSKQDLGAKDINQDLLINNYLLKALLNEGSILFNDELSLRINSIKNNLPEDFKNIQYLTVQSNVPAVFHNNRDLVFMTTGLIARLTSEAELIFFMAKGKALLRKKPTTANNYNFNVNPYLSQSYVDVLHTDKIIEECIISNSVSRQKAAHEKALEVLIDLKLDASAATKAVQILETGRYAIADTPIQVEDLAFAGITFKPEELEEGFKKISLTNSNNNSKSFHSELSAQIKYLESKISPTNNTGKFYLDTQDQFESIKALATFALINHELNLGNIKRAIYYSLICKREYPDNYFVNSTLARAFYALTAFANANKWSKVKNKDRKIKGEYSKFNYFINKQSKEEINLFTLQLIESVLVKFPDDKTLANYQKNIQRDIASYTTLSPNSFFQFEDIEEVKEKVEKLDTRNMSRAERIRAKQRLREQEEALLRARKENKSNKVALRPSYLESFDSTKIAKISAHLNGGEDSYYQTDSEPITAELIKNNYNNKKNNYNELHLLNIDFYSYDNSKEQLNIPTSASRESFIKSTIPENYGAFNTHLVDPLAQGSVEAYNQKSILNRFITEINFVGGDVKYIYSNQDIVHSILQANEMKFISTLRIINVSGKKKEHYNVEDLSDLVLFVLPPYTLRILENKFFQKSATSFRCTIYSPEESEIIQTYFIKRELKPSKALIRAELYNIESTLSNQ